MATTQRVVHTGWPEQYQMDIHPCRDGTRAVGPPVLRLVGQVGAEQTAEDRPVWSVLDSHLLEVGHGTSWRTYLGSGHPAHHAGL